MWNGEIAKLGPVDSTSSVYVVSEDLELFPKIKNLILSPNIPTEVVKKLTNPFLSQSTNLRVMNLVYLSSLLKYLVPREWEVTGNYM
jgi:hypothetical protein